jgi:hypothetical protein
MKEVVAYCRVACAKQSDPSAEVQLQEQMVRRYADARGLTIRETYLDAAVRLSGPHCNVCLPIVAPERLVLSSRKIRNGFRTTILPSATLSKILVSAERIIRLVLCESGPREKRD